ncbi:MAG: hypothetical protein NWE93_12440 [Candidatus Bathyarchaeota archaeon]|nr:hypothetical protein [Candidatus Bathyarchaeota archaeon]
MRFLKDKRGQVRVIEAFFASMLILSCLTLIPAQQTAPSPSIDLDAKAQNVLSSLDGQGHLAELIGNRDWTGLRENLASALPLAMWFNLTVYDADMNVLNDYPICNGGAVSNTVSSVTYVCASQSSNFEVYVLQLQLAVVR